MLNKFFQSVFSPTQISNAQPTTSLMSPNKLTEIYLTTTEIQEILSKIDPNKASGPDNLPGRILKEVASEISPSIAKLFNLSLSLGCFPEQWKMDPIHKKDDPTLVQNYRPISLLCILSKVFERCVPILVPSTLHLQHGFLEYRSKISQLLLVYHDILTSLSKGHEVDVIFLDLGKAFDRVPTIN